MRTQNSAYPVIDLFAGPGGLGEGFASLLSEKNLPRFKSALSVECDEHAHRTLQLRHFFREFPQGEAPDEYYACLKGDLTIDELFGHFPDKFESASSSARMIRLGESSRIEVKKLIDKRLAESTRWALVGGPPCQAYSLVGRSRMQGYEDFESDHRHFLYKEYLNIIADHSPPIFVMENVKGLLSARVNGQPTIRMILKDLRNPHVAMGKRGKAFGYNLYSLSTEDVPEENTDPAAFLVRAEEYGVPQCRHRIFIVGVRDDLSVRPGQLLKHDAPSVGEVIGRLPKLRSGVSRRKDDSADWQREVNQLFSPEFFSWIKQEQPDLITIASHQQQDARYPKNRAASKPYKLKATSRWRVVNDLVDERLGVLASHETRTHMPSDLRRYCFAAIYTSVLHKSPKLQDFPDFLLPAHANVEEGKAGNMFGDRFRVQLRDRPATTITSHISKDGHYFIHYDPLQCRSLTVREAARLQTFPDNYHFTGPRTEQYHQVGNAVPVYLARQIAEIVAEVLDQVRG